MINKAMKLLSGKTVLAVINQDNVFVSEKSGISELLDLQLTDQLQGACVADKIVGKASALLLARGGAEHIYAEVISRTAIVVLQTHNIAFEYGSIVDTIRNRRGDDVCPMEKTVLNIDDTELAYQALQLTLKKIKEARF